ncbi:MAG: PAS domain-containing protein [Gammaproteobacteria bacterium]|nr:PAS domain-containing protein [Gammaproteobacteria bacterium]
MSFLVIVASFGIMIYQEISHRQSELIVEAKAFDNLLAQDLVSIVARGEPDKASDVTSRLAALNKVEALTVYNKNKQAVYTYGQENIEAISTMSENWQQKYELADNSLFYYETLKYRDNEYGYIFIQLSAAEINETINNRIKQAIIVLFVLLITSFFLAWLIQWHFSSPIQQLVKALRKTVSEHDYSSRLPVDREDEIGELFNGFNELQDQIEEEKKALHDQQFAFDQHNIVGITDVKGTIMYANDMFVKISGYSREELIGKNHSILNSAYHDEQFFKNMYQTISAGRVWRGDICNKSKAGIEYWVATTIVPFMGENKKPISYMAMTTDITEQKSTKSNLTRAQKMVHIGSWEYDLIRNKLHWSNEIFKIFEIDEDEFSVTYEMFVDVIHPDDRAMVEKAYKNSVKSGVPYEIEHRLLMKDGRVKIVREQCETYYDENGKPLRSMGVVHDITQSKHTEEALRRSQKMDAVGQLTGGIAHDFNNIMGIILGNIELLELQSIQDEKITKRMHPIKKSAERAVNLTRQLLSFSRRKADQLSVVNINDQLSEMKSLIEHSITPEIEVVYQFGENLWITKIDPGDFQDAVINIVINARDAMDRSGHLTIESSNCHLDEKYCLRNPDVKQGDYVQLIISDNGKGMSIKQQERVFEPFYTTKAEGSGTGLGLAMVFGFIERSEGHIKVYSEIGIGTTFRIYLPRAYKTDDLVIESAEEDSESLLRGNETILVVDDEEGLRELARDTLEYLGYKVLISSNGKKALQVLEANPHINLVFSDIVMPGGINGYELAEQVAEKYPQLKILLTSGYTQKAVARNGQARFAVNLLSKPYSRQELAKRIRDMLEEAE